VAALARKTGLSKEFFYKTQSNFKTNEIGK
jgi:DNA-binding phage protein